MNMFPDSHFSDEFIMVYSTLVNTIDLAGNCSPCQLQRGQGYCVLLWLNVDPRLVLGLDSADATSSKTPTEDFAAQLAAVDTFQSRPLAGKRVAVVRELMGAGVDAGVDAAVQRAINHLESLGATLEEVRDFNLTLPPILRGNWVPWQHNIWCTIINWH